MLRSDWIGLPAMTGLAMEVQKFEAGLPMHLTMSADPAYPLTTSHGTHQRHWIPLMAAGGEYSLGSVLPRS